MADAHKLSAIKTKLRQKLEKRKKERQNFATNFFPKEKIVLSLAAAEVEKALLQILSANNLILPIISTELMEKISALLDPPPKEMVHYILNKFASQGAICIQSVTINQDIGYEVISVESDSLLDLLRDIRNENFDLNNEIKRKLADEDTNTDEETYSPRKATKTENNLNVRKDDDASNDIMSLLSMPSTREKQSKQVGEEILELLTKPTAKERSVAEKFKSQGGAQVMEFCPHGTKIECLKAQQATAEMAAKKKEKDQKLPQNLNKVSEISSCLTTKKDEEVKEKSKVNLEPDPAQKQKVETNNIEKEADLEHNIDIAPDDVLVVQENQESTKENLSNNGKIEDDNSNNNNINNSIDIKTADSSAEDGEISDNLKENETETQSTSTAQRIEAVQRLVTDDAVEEETITTDTCTKLHFKKIIQSHTDESLGDCSFLNTCFHMATCKYVHYEVDTIPNINTTKPADVKSKFIKRSIDPSVILYPPQWIQCDLRFLDMTVLGKFSVVYADPPWDIHMELPYGTMSDDEMRQLGVPALQDDGLIFLWVTGRAMELGRECLKLWGYERVDELIWVKTNQLQRIIRTGRTGHWLNHGKEHCLVGMKGNPQNLNRGLDCDVIVAEVRATSHKPDEIYGIIERLSPGTRKIELFGRPHNVQPNWITLGNQLDGIRLVDPELITQFQKRYPDGNCMSPASAAAEKK